MATCGTIARFVLVLLNLVLFIVGALLIVAGVLAVFIPDTIIANDILKNSEDFQVILDASYLMVAAWAVVGLGVVVVVVAFCGCLGSACVNKVLLGIYIFVVIQIILVQAGIGVLIVLSPSWFESSAQVTLQTYVALHPDDPFDPPGEKTAETIGWNFLQYSVGCCGIEGISDYENVTTNQAFYASCCKVGDKSQAALLSLDDEEETMKNYNYTDKAACLSQIANKDVTTDTIEYNEMGCIAQLYSNLMLYGIAAIATVAIQIFIVIIACIVCCSASSDEKPI